MSDKEKARELRREGLTLKEICAELDRPIGTICVWCRGVESPKNYNHKKGYRVYSKKAKADALQSIREGTSLEKVSLSTGIPSATLRNWCQKADIDFRKRKTYSEKTRVEALELSDQGMDPEEIKEKLGIDSVHTLLNWLRKG